VEKVNPDLVVRDEDGKVMTVRYEAVNAMLLNEFLKEHRKVEEQQATIAQQLKDFEAKFAQRQKQIEALTATVQKVSEQIALSKPAPQLVANSQESAFLPPPSVEQIEPEASATARSGLG
jgi:septal ring factor EnvC (AmiA/AmiB activator)